MLVQELGDLVSSKGEGDATVIVTPPRAITVRIRPEEITEETLVRNINRTLNLPDPVQTIKIRREATVHTEDLVVDDSRDGEAIEAVGEELP